MEASEQSGTLPHVGVIERNFFVLERCTDVNVYVIACLQASGVLDVRQASSIKAEKCLLLRSAMLYNWLKESKDVSKYEEFLRVMERKDVKQEHIANLLRGSAQEDLMPISEKGYTRLVQIKPKFTNASSGLRIGEDFLSCLISSGAISDTDKEDINIQKANYKRSDQLMTAIMRRSNRALDLFKQALIETKQEHFAAFLDEGEAPGIHINTSRPDLDGRLSEAFNRAIVTNDHAQLFQLDEIGLHPIAVREGNSIEVFIYCRKTNNMETFIDAFNSNELKTILTSILNRLLLTIEPDNTDGIRTKISIDEEEVLAIEKATGIEDWIQDESKIRRHHSKSVHNASVQCDLEDNKPPTHGDVHLAPKFPKAYNLWETDDAKSLGQRFDEEISQPPFSPRVHGRLYTTVPDEDPEAVWSSISSFTGRIQAQRSARRLYGIQQMSHERTTPARKSEVAKTMQSYDDLKRFSSAMKFGPPTKRVLPLERMNKPEMEPFGKLVSVRQSGSHRIIPSSMENLPVYHLQQDLGDEGISLYLESKGHTWKSDEKYKFGRPFRGSTSELHHEVKLHELLHEVKFPILTWDEDYFKHTFSKDTLTNLRQAVKGYLKMGHSYDTLSTIDALLNSRNFVAIFEMVCRIKLPKHTRMDAQNERLFEAFVNNGIDLNDRNKNGETFLMLACENRRIDIVSHLLKLGSYRPRFVLDMDAVDNSGETALMKAEKNNDSKITVALSGFKLILAAEDEKEYIVKSMIDVVFNASEILVKSWDSESSRFDMMEEDFWEDTRHAKKNKFDIWENAMYIAMGKVGRHSEAVQKLLLNCDVLSSVEAEIGYPVIHRLMRHRYTVKDNKRRLVEMLLQSGKINVNARDEDGCTALHLANDETLASLLIRYGADVNKKDNEGKTPLMTGILRDYEVSILRRILVDEGTWVDLDAMDCNGRTALIIGTMQNNSGDVELLLNAGASVNLSDHLGLTALHHALYGNITKRYELPRNSEELKTRKEIMTILFDAKKQYWYTRTKEWNPWRTKILELLLQRSDVDVNALSFEKFSPLDVAEGWIPQIPSSIGNALKQKGAALNVFKQIESRSSSDFHLDLRCRLTLQRIVCEAVTQSDEDFLKERFLTLIKTFQEQIVSCKDRQGRTALHLAIISFSLLWAMNQCIGEISRINENYRLFLAKEVVHKIISLGCNVNEVDVYGRTALHYADEVLQKCLISEGADTLVKDKDGKSAIDESRRNDYRRSSHRARDLVSAIYERNEETLFFRLMNNKSLEINVLYRDSQRRRRPEKLNPKRVPELLWKDGEYACRHPLVKQITKEVLDLMDVIAKEIERLDPRFAVRPVHIGSSNEGTKIGKPDQFNFYFVLTKISELCEVSQSPELPTGVVSIKRKQTKVGENMETDCDGLFKEDGILNTVKLDWQFRTILMNTVVYVENQQRFDFNLEFRKSRINKYSNILTNSWNTIQKTSNIMMFKPLNFSSVNVISIDIIPCIHVDGWWPDEAISNVSEHIKKFGCNLVFDSPQQQYPWVPYSDSCARISFAKAESDTIKHCCVEAKEAYMIGKTMIEKSQWNSTEFEPFESSTIEKSQWNKWNSTEPFNYILKNCLLYCIEALTPTPEKASKLGLSLEELESRFHQMDRQMWLRCLMKCHLDFVAQDFCPCYFLPNFSLPTGKDYVRSQREYLKHLSWSWMRDDNDRFPDLCRKAYAFYCCTSSDISESCCQLPAPDPLWERFDRDQLMASLCEIAYKEIRFEPSTHVISSDSGAHSDFDDDMDVLNMLWQFMED